MQAPIKSADEFAQLFSVADRQRNPAKYRLMILLSIRLGMRPKEIALMESTWVIGRELRIPQGSSKGRGCRTLALSDEILAAFHAHMEGRKGRVFLTERGAEMKPKGISDAFQRLYDLAGQRDGCCYSGRRTLSTNMVDSNVSLAVVQKVLGHRHLSTTANYISVTPSMIERALYA